MGNIHWCDLARSRISMMDDIFIDMVHIDLFFAGVWCLVLSSSDYNHENAF
jgi:hypothetical protein